MAHKHGSKDGNNTLIEFIRPKAAGKKAPFFYYVWENGRKYKEMEQAALFANVGLRMDGLGHHNVNKSKRSKSVESRSKKGAGRSKHRSSLVTTIGGTGDHRRSKTVGFLGSLDEIDGTLLNEEYNFEGS